uniref:Outer dense fiber protein 1 n=1 Tax=Falco tinnunculus TaxID=100819 RepID=A0A8C4V5Z0_FALTI
MLSLSARLPSTATLGTTYWLEHKSMSLPSETTAGFQPITGGNSGTPFPQKTLGRISFHKNIYSPPTSNFLALMDVKDFDPKEVTVTVRDGKVKVLAEHKEERTTARAKEYNYRSITKEISLPPGVREDEVTYSLGPNGTVKIQQSSTVIPLLHPSYPSALGLSH